MSPAVTRSVTTYTCDRCGHATADATDRGGEELLTRQVTVRAYDGSVGGATTQLWLCGTCSTLLAAFLAGPGTTEKKLVPVPVEVDRVPDYSCRPCRDGDHARCQRRLVYPDWSADCTCLTDTPHFRSADVLVTVLDRPVQ